MNTFKFTLQAFFLFAQAFQFFFDIHQFRKGQVNRRLRKQGRYRIFVDSCLILLNQNLAGIAQGGKEGFAVFKNCKKFLIFGHNKYFCLFARRNVHGCPYSADTPNSLFDGFRCSFFCGKVPCILPPGPCRNHNRFLFLLKVAEYFLGNKRHKRVQKL